MVVYSAMTAVALRTLLAWHIRGRHSAPPRQGVLVSAQAARTPSSPEPSSPPQPSWPPTLPPPAAPPALSPSSWSLRQRLAASWRPLLSWDGLPWAWQPLPADNATQSGLSSRLHAAIGKAGFGPTPKKPASSLELGCHGLGSTCLQAEGQRPFSTCRLKAAVSEAGRLLASASLSLGKQPWAWWT